jgi:predicted small lipoprotein YifL
MRLILLICTVLLLAGCGKKGALYLPDPPPPMSSQPEAR